MWTQSLVREDSSTSAYLHKGDVSDCVLLTVNECLSTQTYDLEYSCHGACTLKSHLSNMYSQTAVGNTNKTCQSAQHQFIFRQLQTQDWTQCTVGAWGRVGWCDLHTDSPKKLHVCNNEIWQGKKKYNCYCWHRASLMWVTCWADETMGEIFTAQCAVEEAVGLRPQLSGCVWPEWAIQMETLYKCHHRGTSCPFPLSWCFWGFGDRRRLKSGIIFRYLGRQDAASGC